MWSRPLRYTALFAESAVTAIDLREVDTGLDHRGEDPADPLEDGRLDESRRSPAASRMRLSRIALPLADRRMHDQAGDDDDDESQDRVPARGRRSSTRPSSMRVGKRQLGVQGVEEHHETRQDEDGQDERPSRPTWRPRRPGRSERRGQLFRSSLRRRGRCSPRAGSSTVSRLPVSSADSRMPT